MLTQNLYTLIVMKYLMKTLLPLLGTEKTEENYLTPNFSHEFQQQKKNICKNAHGLRLTQNLYTIAVTKELMKTFPPVRKTASTVMKLKNRRELINT